MTREEKISAALRQWWAAQPRAHGLRVVRNNTPEGLCICCRSPAVPKSRHPDAVRKRSPRSRSDYFDTCGGAECKVIWFKLWRRDERAAQVAEATS